MNGLFKPCSLIVVVLLYVTPVVKAESSSGAQVEQSENAATVKQEESDTTSKVERFVAPVTRWIEDAVRDSPLMRQSEGGKKPSEPQTNNGMDLRTAILSATNQFPGTVLNAEKETLDGVVQYRIRILSEQGVVKTVVVNALENDGDSR